ncbi:TetR/AcrR family transcriptional regulator [Rhodococcus phenolicus]|uniref:TetR/AcrR family transcriptional regulator n=1 Tax=Rhodococcus phenolicus TaxID=263849 RepID=UPI00082A6CAA|nr:TetR/AcrR family transcriptional regulator [Rhodococcus phenolicus]
MPDRATPDTTRRSAAARSAILDAAVELVGDAGYAKLSIEAIAARAGVGKQTIYRWWPSKGSVLLDAYLRLSTGDDPQQPAALPDTGDLAADLRTVLHAIVAEFTDPRFERPLRAVTLAVLTDTALAEEYRTRVDGPVREAKIRRLRIARESGQLAPDTDLDVALDTIFAPLTQRWLFGTGPLTTEYADELIETALVGLSPR